jgi:tRNA1(Val) A37 N6-methylase TrmN6
MPLEPTPLQKRLVGRLQEDLSPDRRPPYNWDADLKKYQVVDGFSIILNESITRGIFPASGSLTFDDWIVGIQDWLENLWDPCASASKPNVLLAMLWDHFERDLADNLRRARVAASIPSTGGVLVYVGALSKCIVISYSFAGLSPKLLPIAVIPYPLSAFDFWGAIDQANATARNFLKSILASGHKLLYERGVLVHVDRRLDAGVFGPSIDTLLLGELLARDIFEPDLPITTVLEVGSGSGFLASCVVRHCANLKELYCLDVDSKAIACTEKNIRIAKAVPGVAPFSSHLNVEGFDREWRGKKFDLIICNPPYIPYDVAPERVGADNTEYINAVSGTELLQDLLASGGELLTDGGKLLLMLSSLCMKNFLEICPSSLKPEFPFGEKGFRVIFDVEAVLKRRPWRDYLSKECGLESEGEPGKEVFYHHLHPVWLTKK